MPPHVRAAWGGIAGPAAFVSAWIAGGALRRGYSPVDDAISRLAAVGTASRPLMTAGFVAFGIGVPAYAAALRASVPGPAWVTATASGVATLAVATLPLGASRGIDAAHGGFAALGYATLALTPLLAAQPLAASGHRRAAAASAAVGAASALCLAASVAGPAHGLFQRLGLTLGDAWVMATAAWILSGGRATVTATPGRGTAIFPPP